MKPEELLSYLRAQALAVESSVSSSGTPQAAVVVAVTDRFEPVFDTVATSRKHLQTERVRPAVRDDLPQMPPAYSTEYTARQCSKRRGF